MATSFAVLVSSWGTCEHMDWGTRAMGHFKISRSRIVELSYTSLHQM